LLHWVHPAQKVVKVEETGPEVKDPIICVRPSVGIGMLTNPIMLRLVHNVSGIISDMLAVISLYLRKISASCPKDGSFTGSTVGKCIRHR
jgi:hypothetical protein